MSSMCSWNGTMETWVQDSHSFRGGGPHCFLRSQADEGRRLTGGQTLRVVTALSVVLSGHHYPANPIRTLNPCRISIIIFRLGKAQVRSFFLDFAESQMHVLNSFLEKPAKSVWMRSGEVYYVPGKLRFRGVVKKESPIVKSCHNIAIPYNKI